MALELPLPKDSALPGDVVEVLEACLLSTFTEC